MAQTRSRGRPPLAAAERRSEVMLVRITKAERKTVGKAAKLAGMTVAGLMREATLDASARIIKEAERG